ncbi:MAG: DUF2855 family protein [Pseudomarimonas sp.]
MAQFQVRKDHFETHRVVQTEDVADASLLKDGEVLLRVDQFAFTANNITYAVAGDSLGYWQFFPAVGVDAEGWGTTPVWGFADVVNSRTDSVPVGERLFGYFPPANQVTISPVRISAQRLFDGAAHRATLPPGYNSYTRVNAEPGYDRRFDELRMLLFPLHLTSFCLWDMLQSKDWFGARQVLILSASSKTSIGLAFAMSEDAAAPPAIALTSPRSAEFVGGLGLYKQVLGYDDVSGLDSRIPTVIVDMSGNADALSALSRALGDNMRRCIQVGMTHWQSGLPAASPNADRSEFFFAPGHVQKRMQEWGVEEFATRTSDFLRRSAAQSRGWLKVSTLAGLNGLAALYPDICAGRIDAEQGLIVQM